ncbi:MAG: Gfo/Idh/MocA family protein [Limnochordia bacterium]|jgi:predicted dehydrogenase
MSQIRTAVIGVGTFGQWHARAYSELTDAQLVAVADVNAERAQRVAELYGAEAYQDYRALLERKDVDAVSVVLPDHMHREACIEAARAGKHILVEKPLATSEDDAQAILEAVEQAGIRLMVDFANRWSPPFLHAKAALDEGEIGLPVHISMKLNDTLEVPLHMLRWSSESSVAWFLGSHCVDLLRWLLSDEVAALRAVSRSRVLREQGVDTPDFYQTVLEFSSGTVAYLENSWVLPTANATVFEFEADIVGSKGRIRIDTAQHSCIQKTTDRLSHPDVLMFNEVNGKLAGFGILPMAHFVTCLQQDLPFQVTIDDALQAVKLVAAIERSAACGGKVITFEGP